jgi:hypothetical protein
MLRRCVLLLGASVLAFSTVASAADFASLDWGQFKVDPDSAVKPNSVSVVTGNDQLGLTMSFTALQASADAQKSEDSASLMGEFVVSQPAFVSLPKMVVEVHGHIVKAAGSTANIALTVGPSTQTITWASTDVDSGNFARTFTADVPNGQLPTPFPISATILVTRDQSAQPILVTVDQLTVKVGGVHVAELVIDAPTAR